MTLATWGGDYTKTEVDAYLKPFTRETRSTYRTVDAPGEYVPKLAAQVAANRVTWDVIDTLDSDANEMAAKGFLARLPADVKARIVDAVGETNLIGQPNVTDYGVTNSLSSFVIACNRAVVQRCPTTPAEFWDVQRFPGRRTMYSDGWAEMPMAALVADGADPRNLFPLDLDRAYRRLDEIKSHIQVFWKTGDQSEQIFRDKEVGIGLIWDGRAGSLIDNGLTNLQMSFNGMPVYPSKFVVPKDAPHQQLAFRFLEWYAQHPKAQAKYILGTGYGTASPEAFKYIPKSKRNRYATYPQNLRIAAPLDPAWASKHRAELVKRWTDWVGG